MNNPMSINATSLARRGFEIVDSSQPNIVDIRAIEPWYRQRTFLYVAEKALDQIPSTVRWIRSSDEMSSSPIWRSSLCGCEICLFGTCRSRLFGGSCGWIRATVRIGTPPN